MIRVLFSASSALWKDYQPVLLQAFAEIALEVDLAVDHPPADVDYIIFAPDGPVRDFTPYTACKGVLGLWAGVETVVGNTTLTQPLARMVDPGLTAGMVQWVAGHVLRHHLDIDTDIHATEWQRRTLPLTHERRVTILGLGALGAAVAAALVKLGFDVAGWSRRGKTQPGVATFHGAEGLTAALARSEILVLLLPATAATDCLLNQETLAALPRGAVVINPGRGTLIDDDALLAALDSGQLGHATLDVFREEPLCADHPFFAHPRVTVTPHIASETRPGSAARTLAANIARNEAGDGLAHLVDRVQGY